MNCDTNLIRFDESKPGKNNMKFNITYKVSECASKLRTWIFPLEVQYPKPEDAVPNEKVSYSLLMSFDNLDERAGPTGLQGVSGYATGESSRHDGEASSEIFGKEKEQRNS
jgi:hypothetical protein